jgi:hypothetical protein
MSDNRKCSNAEKRFFTDDAAAAENTPVVDP